MKGVIWQSTSFVGGTPSVCEELLAEVHFLLCILWWFAETNWQWGMLGVGILVVGTMTCIMRRLVNGNQPPPLYRPDNMEIVCSICISKTTIVHTNTNKQTSILIHGRTDLVSKWIAAKVWALKREPQESSHSSVHSKLDWLALTTQFQHYIQF